MGCGLKPMMYFGKMTLEQIAQEAIALPKRERASLICKLLETLPPPDHDVSDEEVTERDRELGTGAVAEISHEELVRRVRKNRRR